MRTLLKAASLSLLIAQSAPAQSGETDSILGANDLSNIYSLLKGKWVAERYDHLGGREVMIVLDDEMAVGRVDRDGSVKMSYQGGYKIDRSCNGTMYRGIYIVTEEEIDPCWRILNLDLSKLKFRDKSRLANSEFVLESR